MVLFLDTLAFLFMALNSFIGFNRGFIEELGRLLGLLLSSIIASHFYVELGTFLARIFPADPWAIFVLSFILIFLGSLFGIRLLTKLIHFMFLSNSTKWVNKFLGAFFGFMKGVLIVMIFFWMFELVPNKNISDAVINNSFSADKLLTIRKNIISTFNWSDPVKKGETAINSFLGTID
tara:strand:- start:2327 stop:2860 length:534 start_codon:yes stop_codon:yes gene_type:complete